MLFWMSYMHVFYIFVFVLVQCNWVCFTWKGPLEIQSLLLSICVNLLKEMKAPAFVKMVLTLVMEWCTSVLHFILPLLKQEHLHQQATSLLHHTHHTVTSHAERQQRAGQPDKHNSLQGSTWHPYGSETSDSLDTTKHICNGELWHASVYTVKYLVSAHYHVSTHPPHFWTKIV